MKAEKLHDKLMSFGLNVPIIALPEKVWQEQLKNFIAEYFKQNTFKEMETPLKGIVANFATKIAPIKPVDVTYLGYDNIQIKNYAVQFELKTVGVNGYMSKHVIEFDYITFKVVSQGGFIKLIRQNESYKVISNQNAQDERQKHLDELKNAFAYTDEQIEYFQNRQEPAAGFLVADGILERLNTPFNIIDLNKLFSRIGFIGEFSIKDINVDGEELICFIADAFKKKPPTQCQIEEVYNGTYSNGELKANGDLQVSAGVFPATLTGKNPEPNNGGVGQLYLFLPEDATHKLFSFDNPLDSRTTLVNNSGSLDIPPYYLEHKTEIYTEKKVEFEWNQAEPTVHLKASVNLAFYLQAFIKVFRIKTNIGTVDTNSNYTIEYQGKLMELINGDLAFVGELYDPSNFTIEKFQFDSILPDFLNEIISKIVKYIFEPLLRVFITAIVIYVTWPLMENYTMNAFANAGIDMGKNKLPKTKLTDYYTNKKSALFGIATYVTGID